jgi:signal transduction histidine kinase
VARLHSRIYVNFLAVLLVVGVTTGLVFTLGARDAFRRTMHERMTRHVAALAADRLSDPTALRRRLAEVHDDFGIDVTVRDVSGTVIASAGEVLPAPETGAVAEPRADRRRPRHHRPFAAAPIRDAASGAIVATVVTGDPPPMGLPPMWRPAVVVALALLVVAVCTRPLAQRISRPLERLTEAARRLGGGDLSARVPVPAGGRRRVDEITELTGAFNEMADRVQRLVRGEKELLANVSHELRSPLARIRVALALVPRASVDAGRLDDVERDLTDLERLIEDVLTTARLEATGLPTHLATVDVRALLAEVAERARHDPLTASSVVSVVDGPDVTVTADEALLRRALWNLVENAAKYGAPPIELASARAGEHVTLSVTDAGPGIPAAQRERVFSPFYRADTAHTPASNGAARRGVGLGLTLAKRVAEVHGGSIALGPASTDGGDAGCRVVITLPA